MAEGERELRAALEVTQHEVRALKHELTLPAHPEFVARREALERELAPLREQSREVGARAHERAKRLADVQVAIDSMERSLREREQRNLSLMIALLAIVAISVSGRFIGSLSMYWVAAISGLGLGWLLMGHVGAGEREEAKIEAAPRSFASQLVGIVGPLAMFLLSPFIAALQATNHRHTDFSELWRVGIAAALVVIAGVTARFGRRGVLLACSFIVAMGMSVFIGRQSASSNLPGDVVDDRVAAIISCFALPMILATLWFAGSSTRRAIWLRAAAALFAGAVLANAWLLMMFRQPNLRFSSFSSLALELCAAAIFFALEAPPSLGRRVLFVLCGGLAWWTVLVTAVLLSMRVAVAQ